MELVGNFFLFAAFAFTIAALFFLFIQSSKSHQQYRKAIFHLHYLIFFSIFLSLVSLLYLLLNGNMNVEYVASFTSHDLSPVYKISALWAGQSGSLLLWSFILISFNTFFWLRYRNRYPGLQIKVTAIVMMTQLFFLSLNIWAVNPFKILMAETPQGLEPFTPSDGHGLNPLLHHPAMIIHPPVLFIGYIGSVIPFALALAAMWLNNFKTMTGTIQRWVIFSWLFLTAGIGLGSWWAYVELGWGGYWAWDPVENASLMPWLLATALMHTLIIQRKLDMFFHLNLFLAGGFYFFCILGTFITRSGLINSVHAFSQSNVGYYFLIFLFFVAVSFFGLFLTRKSLITNGKKVTSFLSEESFSLLLTITLTILTLAILLGTLYPSIAESLSGKVIMLDVSYYNRLTRFITVVIIILMISSNMFFLLRDTNVTPAVLIFMCTVLLVISVMFIYIVSHDTIITMFSSLIILSIFLLTLRLLIKARLGKKEYSVTFLSHLKNNLFSQFGPYFSHIGFLFICIGIMGSVKNDTAVLDGKTGQSFEFKNNRFTILDFNLEKNRLFESLTGHIKMTSLNGSEYSFRPQFRYYYAGQQTSSEIAINSNLMYDTYIVLSNFDQSTETGRFQIYYNPLVAWIWIGACLLITGSLISLIKKQEAGMKADYNAN